MRCPECGSSQIFVINSRPRDGINAVWRKTQMQLLRVYLEYTRAINC